MDWFGLQICMMYLEVKSQGFTEIVEFIHYESTDLSRAKKIRRIENLKDEYCNNLTNGEK